MFLEEAKWIKAMLFTKREEIYSILDIGSSSFYFRSIIQPFIENELFKPLRQAGKKIAHMDKKDAPGVDIVLDAEDLDKLHKKFDAVLCCNVFEHMKKPKLVSKHLRNVVRRNGFLIVTIPYTYPYHCSPFDNLWRPHPNELIQVFYDFKPLVKEIIKVKTTSYKFLMRRILSLIETIYDGRPEVIFKNIKQVFRHPFSISCVLFCHNID